MNKTNPTAHPLSDVVSRQYESWRYPEPILDLDAWLADNWQWFDPSHAHRMFWPDQEYKAELDILIAGCGTNQAAVFAYSNPRAKVVAIDVSEPSLNHHRYLKDKYGLENLELHLLPIEKVNTLNRDYDLIVSTGVLHHLENPGTGMKALAGCLRQDGVIALMLYAKYGRIGVGILQSIAHDLGLGQNERSIRIVRDMLETLPQDHPIRSYLTIASDLKFDAGLVDTFLHGRERCYTIDECLELVTSSGLVFQDLFLKSPYHPLHSQVSESAFYSSIAELPRERQWSIMERVNFRNACHFFTACHVERSKETYEIDFESRRVREYVPSHRYRCTITGNTLSRNDWSVNLNPLQAAIVQRVDGHRTISEILIEVSMVELLAEHIPEDFAEFGRTLFKTLWQLDFLAMGLKTRGQ